MNIFGLWVTTTERLNKLLADTRAKVYTSQKYKKTVATEAYNLTHEFTTNKLWDEFTKGTYLTAPDRRVLLNLDREMRTFTEGVSDGE